MDKENASHRRSNLLEQLQPFRAHRIFKTGESRCVPAGSGQALDEAGIDRIRGGHEYDWCLASMFQQAGDRRGTDDENDILSQGGDIGGKLARKIVITGSPIIVQLNAGSLDPSASPKLLAKSRQACLFIPV